MTEHDAERIELPGGWHFERSFGDPRYFRLRMPNGSPPWTSWAEDDARAFAAAIRPEPSADAGGEAAKLVDDFETAAIHRGCCPHAGGCSSDDCLPRLGRNRAALLDHIAGLRAEIERYRAAYEVEKKYSALRCDEVARLRTENETLNADKGRGHRYRDKMLAELAAKDAEIERLTKECDEDLADKEDDLDRFKAAAATMREQIVGLVVRAEKAEAALAATPKELRTWWQAEEARHKAVETYNAKRQRHIDEGVFPPVVQEEFARITECEKATSTALKALFAVRSLPASEPAPAQASPVDRDTLGRFVREAWIRWALTQQPRPKPSWLIPYDELSEAEKEADRQIGEAVTKWTLIHQDAARAFLVPAQDTDALREAAQEAVIDAIAEALYYTEPWTNKNLNWENLKPSKIDMYTQHMIADFRERARTIYSQIDAALNSTGEA